MECDASGYDIGAVLMQASRLIAFHSQALKGKSIHLSTYEKELLALATIVKKWRPYLLGKPFVIKTNYQSLKHLLEQRIGTPMQQKWITKLLGYSFVIDYKKGNENVVADALFRKTGSEELAEQQELSEVVRSLFCIDFQDDTNNSLFLISFSNPTWIEELKASYQGDVEV